MTGKTRRVIIGQEGKTFTPEEWDAHVERLGNALQAAPEIVRYLEKNHPDGPFRTRLPIGLIAEREIKPGEAYMFEIRPFLKLRPWAMVLADETAEAFDVHDFKIGNVTNLPAGGPVPLDTCAIRHIAASANPDKLLDVQDWGGGLSVDQGMKLTVMVRNARGTKPIEFRGILWARCAVYP